MTHRIRKAKSTDGKSDPHIFVELADGWLEVNTLPTIETLPDFLAVIERCKKLKPNGTIRKHLRLAERAFHIGIIKDWIELEPITV